MRAIAVLMTISALGSFMTPLQASTFVYVGNSDSQDITVLELGNDGGLKPLATVPVPGPSKPGASLPLAAAPDKRFLYAGLRNEPYSVSTFSINAKTGLLNFVGSAPLADSMAYLATDRSGRFLLSASYGGNKVTVNAIGANGVVGELRQTIIDVAKAHCILPDAANRFALFTSLGGDRIYQRKFDPKTGMLSPNTPEVRDGRTGAGPRHFVFSPGEQFVYLLNELDASVSVFPYDSRTGTLGKETQSVPTLPGDFDGKPWAADLHLTPNGKFLYASERTTSLLTAFRVDGKNGTLKSAGSYPTVKQPRAFSIDPSGRYLLVVGQLSNSLMIYGIDGATGKLTALKEYTVGKNPNWVEVVPLP